MHLLVCQRAGVVRLQPPAGSNAKSHLFAWTQKSAHEVLVSLAHFSYALQWCPIFSKLLATPWNIEQHCRTLEQMSCAAIRSVQIPGGLHRQ